MLKIPAFKKFLRSSTVALFTFSIVEWNNAHAMLEEEVENDRISVIARILLEIHEGEKSEGNNTTTEADPSFTSNRSSENDNDIEVLKQWRLKCNTEVLADRPDASVDLFMQNATIVLPKAQHAVGTFYCVEKEDHYEALKWFEKAIKSGCSEAQESLLLAQFRIAQQHYANQKFAEALVWFKKAAKRDANSQYNIGVLYTDGKIAQKSGKHAIKWFERALENANRTNPLLTCGETENLAIKAKEELGEIYLYGRGVSPDLPKAVKYFSEIIDEDLYENSTSVFYDLGLAYYKMNNFSKALENFKIAAQNGNTEAAYNIGAMYNVGEGVEEDLREALSWFEKAKAKSCVEAHVAVVQTKFNIGSEAFIHENYLKALEFYEMAAADGHMHAPDCIARMYYFGTGVPVNYPEALKWFRKAQANGHPEALNYVMQTYHKMYLETLK